MAILTFSGLDAELALMSRLEKLPEEVQIEILNAQAQIVYDEIRRKGIAYRVKDTGMTLKALKQNKAKRDKNGDLVKFVTFKGKTQKGIRYAEIAFVNNYGRQGQAARPFVTEAAEAAAKPAFEVAEKIYNAWVDAQEQKG